MGGNTDKRSVINHGRSVQRCLACTTEIGHPGIEQRKGEMGRDEPGWPQRCLHLVQGWWGMLGLHRYLFHSPMSR